LLILPFAGFSQTTYLALGDKQYDLLNRLEIKAQTDSVLNFSKTRPFSRKQFVPVLEKYYNTGKLVQSAGEIPVSLDGNSQKIDEVGSRLTKIDLYNAERALMANSEWTSLRFPSKKPVLKNFCNTPSDLFAVHVKDFDLVINPAIQFVISKEKDNNDKLFLNTRGLIIRGRIANKIGFYSYLSDNQERDPSYVQQWISDRTAVPGAGFYKKFKAPGGVDYFDARGYFTFNVTKYIDVAFGYDRNFIGNGYRSMLLSDFSAPNLFLKLNTRIWKINYQNLFMELANADPVTGDHLKGKKYLTIHHLDIGVTKWLNIGLFEAITFGRVNHIEFSYLNPIIFYRSVEQQNGSPDKAKVAMDLKANVAKRFQFYGQVLLDEFVLSEIKKNRGFWANKWAIQMGVKYIDAFNIKNLDLQLEHNRVRPFTYSHGDSVANYTHYNQPLADPLMANFKELIGIARYQPAPKWRLEAKAILYQQGRDSSAASYGSNIFLPYGPPYRQMDYGYWIGSGWKTDVTYLSFLVSYELRENMFLDLSAVTRRLKTVTAPVGSQHADIISFGFRWNLSRRMFEF
jgi:hypothetical protein